METQAEIVENIKRRQQQKEQEFSCLKNPVLPIRDWQYEVLNRYVRAHGVDENVKEFEQFMYCSYPSQIYNFACKFDYANIFELSKAIARTSNAEYILRYSLDFGDADQAVLLEGLKNSDDVYYQLKAFFENDKLNDEQLTELAKCVLDNGSKKSENIIRIIKNRLGKENKLDQRLSDIFSKELVNKRDYQLVKKYAIALPLNMEIITKNICSCPALTPRLFQQDVILDFAKTVPNSDKEILTNLMIIFGNEKGLYHLATECDGVDIKAIAKEITKNWSLSIKAEAMADINFRYGIVPEYDAKKYKNEDEYHEDLLLKLKSYKNTDYYKSHKDKKEDGAYQARVILR